MKRKLRKHNHQNCAHLQDDRLFEIRYHGLSAEKKYELEQMLRQFVATLDQPASSNKGKGVKQQESSQKSGAMVDSAYASASTTEPASKSRSPMNDVSRGHSMGQPARSLQRDVDSYLQRVPEPTEVKSAIANSDTKKKKIVVQRLEQLFTGKHARHDRNGLSHQQQEIAESTDTISKFGSTQPHCSPKITGSREAKILPTDKATDLSSKTVSRASKSRGSSEVDTSRSSNSPVDTRSLDQRPTRPLDLDLDRAQVSADNIEYIKHLGQSSPLAGAETDDKNERWVYLNLLINMAQLHTLNVTPEFVKKAVTELSTKFDLSADGQRIRWEGDLGITCPSTKSNSTAEDKPMPFGEGETPMPTEEAKSHKSDKLAANSMNSCCPLARSKTQTISGLNYRPLFLQRSDSNGYVSYTSSDESGKMDLDPDDTEGRSQCQSRAPYGGMFVFYRDGRFCTDSIGNESIDNSGHPHYARSSNQPLGFTDADSHATGSQSSANQALLTKHSVTGQSRQWSGSGSSASSSDAALASLDIRSLSLVCSNGDDNSPRPLVACGLGGVQPDDNFMVKVAVEHSRQPKENIPLRQPPASSQKTQLREQGRSPVLSANGHNGVLKTKIISTETTKLAPSTIPPPSFVHPPFSSSTEADDNSDDEEEGNNNNHHQLKSIDPTNLPKPSNPQIPKDAESDNNDNNDDDDDEDDDSDSSSTTISSSSDDSSIDFLGRARDWQLPNNMSPEDSDEIEDAKYMQEIYEGARDYSVSVASAPSRLSGEVGDCEDGSVCGDEDEDEDDGEEDEEGKGE